MKVFFSKFPIKWKISIWTSVVLFLLFSFFAVFQYFFLKNWMLNYEKKSISEKMAEVQAYLSEKKDIINSQNFLENVNEKDELIKVDDQYGRNILTISSDLSIQGLSYIPKQNEVIYLKRNTDHYLVYKADIDYKGFQGTVEIIRKLSNYTRLFHYMFLMMIIAVIGAVLLSSIGGILIAKHILKPIKALSITMEEIKAKGLKQRVPEFHSKDELTNLTRIFNQMMEDLEISFNKQKQFVEDASHELRTPISILEGHLSMLQRWGKKDVEILEESIEASLHEVKRLKDLVLDLLDLTRVESTRYKKEVFNPIIVIENVIKSFSMIQSDFTFNTNFNHYQHIEILGVLRHFEQLMIIVLDNAIKFSQTNKEIKIISRVKNQQLCIDIIDFGEGIPEKDLAFIFDRFYRVDKARSRTKGGNGIGLSIAQEIVKNFDGTITIQSKWNEGTQVTVCFPVYNKIV